MKEYLVTSELKVTLITKVSAETKVGAEKKALNQPFGELHPDLYDYEKEWVIASMDGEPTLTSVEEA